MPTIIFEMLEGRTIEQKRELAKRITDAVAEVVQTQPERVRIYFHDIPKTNLAQSGVLRSDQEAPKS
jgi:4-oxalocrotonate tautomerase